MTPSTADYPLFVPPAPLAEKSPRKWSSKEARFYFDWLLTVLPQRTDAVLARFGEKIDEEYEDILARIGEKFALALSQSEFSTRTPDGPKLTNQGYALAADMGLLVARFLLEECGEKIHWETLRKPKREMAYNLPVLIGFDIYLEPVGGTIAEAYAILRGTRSGDILKKMFTFWRSKVTGD
jgi:hypothetical protein